MLYLSTIQTILIIRHFITYVLISIIMWGIYKRIYHKYGVFHALFGLAFWKISVIHAKIEN
ncbi:MAG: hypothetical protein DRO88_04395 [Promethearchaeia archaeon]|nr:MAG: hypothetical protein DRO88_04395 [Candidatus Lokiarchaeia archaeon]